MTGSRARSGSVAEATPDQLKIDVAAIVDELADTIDVELEFPLAPITLGTEEFVPVAPARVDVTLTYAGTGIVASGTVAADLAATCSRCLQEFVMTATGDVEGFYVRPGTEAEIPEEQEAELIVGRDIDLLPALRAALALALPFAPVHDEECKGICGTCGADLSAGPCDCTPDLSLSPFAVLKDIITDSGDDA
ncbi:MAG: hypothetical protein CVT59_00760 [Actinobacteria bacterium HGW-Actinobacteria-1]|nr:MAG: hypothetical protein CVT59_00760 [Actinobacteria bacterium HGW-Actinobacteria-1]